MALIMHFRSSLWITLGVYPNAFDGNPLAIEDPFVHIAGTPRGEGEAADTMERTSKCVRCRKDCPSATNVSKFTQALLEGGT